MKINALEEFIDTAPCDPKNTVGLLSFLFNYTLFKMADDYLFTLAAIRLARELCCVSD